MATGGRRSLGPSESDDGFSLQSRNDPNRELFEACRNGDIAKVRKLVSTNNVNAKDTAGRKSSPLHFAAGRFVRQEKFTEAISNSDTSDVSIAKF